MNTAFNFRPLSYPPDAIHVSLDLETASLEPNAAIVQIGACTTEPVNLQNFTVSVDLRSCEREGLDVSKSTMEWWNKQDSELRKQVFGGKIVIKDALDQFYGWLEYISRDNLDRIYLWSKPQCFDIPILKTATEKFTTYPLSHRNVGDVYTLMRTLTVQEQEQVHNQVITEYPALQAHNALHDAIYQRAFIEAGLRKWNTNSSVPQ